MNGASVIGKIVIEGKLILDSPLLIGDGAGEDTENTRDIHVLKDQDGKAFIPGTSLCGVLREYVGDTNPAMVTKIFGDINAMQSSIQIDDIELVDGKIVFRDGVRIDGFTGTGIAGGKYDYEAVDRGARGNLKMLMTLRACHDLKTIKDSIARLLKKLTVGIKVGALTSKGFGQIHVENINAGFYDFTNKNDVAAWLTQQTPAPERASTQIQPSDAVNVESANDLIVDADFIANSSFIVRDYDTREKIGGNPVNAVSLKSRNDFVVPGTSLKGIIRHRAEYILSKFGVDAAALENLMGASDKIKKIKSRFIVSESYVADHIKAIAHTRTRIDRITGGVLQGTLFTTMPVWQATNQPSIHIHFEIHNIGLAIALLRDLWLGRVAIGGEKAVGRGTLKGISARIVFNDRIYELDGDGKIIDGDAEEFLRLAQSIKTFAKEAD